MKINDTTKQFLDLYQANERLTFQILDDFYYKSNEMFEDYFLKHCTKTEDRIAESIQRYGEDIQKIKLIADALPGIIQEVLSCAVQYFGFEIAIEFNLFVGAYGSNAYAYKHSVFLAIEKLPSAEAIIRILVAHEIAHVYHAYYIMKNSDIDWESVPFMHGMTGMYLEGVATYLSKQWVPDMPEYIYYTYDDSGEEWFSFCRSNEKKMAKAFLEVPDWDIAAMREWFRLSGGRNFGHARLGYYLGTRFIEDTIKETSESKALTLLADPSFILVGNNWLVKASS